MNTYTKKITFTLVIILVALSFFVISNKNENTTVKIGVMLPLSGGVASDGEDALAAINIAKEDFGEKDIELVIEDDQFSPKNSLSSFNKFSAMDGLVAIIGPLNGTSIESLRPLAIKEHLPLFTPWGAGNDISEYIYKNSVEGSIEAGLMADKAKELGYKKLAIAYLQNDFGVSYRDAFKERVEKNGGTLVSEAPMPLGTSDFRSIITKIKSSNPDAVYIVNTSAIDGEMIKQSNELGFVVPAFSQYAAESSNIIKIAGNFADGLIYTFPIGTDLNKKQKEFATKFTEKTGHIPPMIAYNSYDIYRVLVDVIGECNTDRVCVNDRLSKMDSYDGVSGSFSIKDNLLSREIFFKVIKNGQFVSL